MLGASPARFSRRLEVDRQPHRPRGAGADRRALRRRGRPSPASPATSATAARQRESRPRVEAFRLWCERQRTLVPGKGDLAKAMRYALTRWASFTLFLDDGRVAIDNNAAERALKAVVLGRKNFLFAGSDAGGEVLADAMTVIDTAKLSRLNPEAYLAEILDGIRAHDPRRLDELLPWTEG